MTTLDPQIAAELEELEALFAEDVRATAPPMPLSLKARLEEGVAAGFPRERKRRRERGLPRWALPAMGAAATALIALVVAFGALRDGTTGLSDRGGEGPVAVDAGGGDTAAESVPMQDASGGGAAAPKLAAPTAPQADSGALQRQERKQERAVELTLRVGAGKLEDAADGVVRTTQQLGGFVADSQVTARGRRGEAYFTLRVPTARLDDATKRLSALGHVQRLDQSTRDITGAFVSAEERLSDARAERRALLRALGRAENAGQIATLRQRIRLNRAEIARFKGELDALRRRADLATISVHVVARGDASAAAPGDDTWSPGDALADALRVLEIAAGVLLIALAVLIPVGLLAALGVAGARTARRRRRENALDAA